MAYFAPYVDETGLHIPTYNDIRDDLVSQARKIFGDDVYLEPDSMDYELISLFAEKINDTMYAAVLAYNNRSPVTAIGSGLDALVKINGIKRKAESYSTCVVTLTGAPGTVINNGLVGDLSDNPWELPTPITLPSNGILSVTAQCQEPGAITAAAHTLNKILTPTLGWITVNNSSPAITGLPLEQDTSLRSRQAISVANPSQTLLEGTIGGIASVSGVTRHRVYENDTNIVDSLGLPPHSITAVVEGGTDQDVAEQVRIRKGIGGYTNGDVEVSVPNIYGISQTIRFYRPVYVDIFYNVTITKLPGYVEGTDVLIKEALVKFTNSSNIGKDLILLGALGSVAALNSDLSNPSFSLNSLTAGKSAGSLGTTDIDIGYKEVPRGNVINITVVVN